MRWLLTALCVALFLTTGCMFGLEDVKANPLGPTDASLPDGTAGDAGQDAVQDTPWPETTPGPCEGEGDCSPNEYCNDQGKCELCTVSWTPAGGGDHCGEDWSPADGETIAGVHMHVGVFTIAVGTTVRVKVREGSEFGEVVVHAREVRIAGTLDATGAGELGGTAGGGGPSTEAGGSGAAGIGDHGGSPGGPGSGGGSACVEVAKEPHAPGGNGQNGSAGGYAAAGANGDSCFIPQVRVGSGGGGGGGGGGGQRSTCCSLSVPGGVGGQGGLGGRGGGAISLRARDAIDLSGYVRTTGVSGASGQGGAEGDSQSKLDPESSSCGVCGGCADHRYAYCPGMGPCGSAQNDCCQRPCCFYYVGGPGGTGGRGGHGAGGGVLLEAPSVSLSGFIDALGGGNDAANGGTIQIIHEGTAPAAENVAGGLVCGI